MRRDDEDLWWWGFGMPAWQRAVVMLLCAVVISLNSIEGWLMLPVVIIFLVCMPSVVELTMRYLRQ